MSDRHALVCAPALPEFDRESGSRRLYDLVCFLQELGWAVSYVAQQADDGARYLRYLRQQGVATYVGFDVPTERLIEASRFDLAILAFWQVAERQIPAIRRLSPETRILVDSIDLHFVRNVRGTFQKARGAQASSGVDALFGSETARELNVYAAADGVLTVSQKEADLLNDWLGNTDLARVVPDAEDLPRSSVLFEQRRGILFIGNFRHAPNLAAAEYLCHEIVPLLDPTLLAEHPLYIVGNGLNDHVRRSAAGLEHVQLIGWVPSVLPYLHGSRISVVPLRYGAGTKRKLVQALMTGTPSVSTTIGAEGLDVAHEEHLLVGEGAESFARAVERLLVDEILWRRLAIQGRDRMLTSHGRAAARSRLECAIAAVLQRWQQPLVLLGAGQPASSYEQLIQQIRAIVAEQLPSGASILVVSKGDPALLHLDKREAAHFPQADDGNYAGHYPADSAAAISHLEALRGKGAQFLLFPNTAFWWLQHYDEFHQHLGQRYPRVWSDDICVIYRLTPAPVGESPAPLLTNTDEIAQQRRPAVPAKLLRAETGATASKRNVLVLGVYLATEKNNVQAIVADLASAQQNLVTQQWVALGGGPPTASVAAVTVREVYQKTPKFQLLNELLSHSDLGQYDYVLLVDDDIVLPDGFLDRLIALQDELDFALAQPARTGNSYIDHPIVEQQLGVLARRTQFVEIGPVVSFHRSCFDLVFPFDLDSPMGWGYENRWAYLLAHHGLKMGIIDALPIDHSLRKPVAHYSWAEADRQRKQYLRKHEHFPLDQCFRVLEVVGFQPSAAEK